MLSIPSTRSSPQDVLILKKAFYIALSFVVILWAIELLKFFAGLDTFKLGTHPQQLSGLIGVVTAPLIHASFEHLISNTPALLILGTALLYGYPRSRWVVLFVVWILAELGVWFTARPVFHFGASGLTYGIMAFVFVVGILRRDRLAITLSLLVFFLYGTMIWGIFPHQPGVSFETHFWGAGLGAICAVIFRNYDPTPPAKQYSWENEDEEDSVIGEAWSEVDSDAKESGKAE
ncbi:MAG: rhomboid family intramembrane serine protease [Gammaproteobacteria bacterium]|nr:MAG: rhomboid family intramembrane serine protease [Gammaproteobacteria bacterium]